MNGGEIVARRVIRWNAFQPNVLVNSTVATIGS